VRGGDCSREGRDFDESKECVVVNAEKEAEEEKVEAGVEEV
jgi:hypothetical protein